MFGDIVMKQLFQQNPIQSGGGNAYNVSFYFFFIGLLFFFIKVLLVMISYNFVIPKITQNTRFQFKTITFVESIFLVILFNNLFSRF